MKNIIKWIAVTIIRYTTSLSQYINKQTPLSCDNLVFSQVMIEPQMMMLKKKKKPTNHANGHNETLLSHLPVVRAVL